jgi:hypothetical protein
VISTRYEARNYTLFCIIILFLLLICFVPLVGETKFHTHINILLVQSKRNSVANVSSVSVSTEFRTSTSPLISCLYAGNEDSLCDDVSGY